MTFEFYKKHEEELFEFLKEIHNGIYNDNENDVYITYEEINDKSTKAIDIYYNRKTAKNNIKGFPIISITFVEIGNYYESTGVVIYSNESRDIDLLNLISNFYTEIDRDNKLKKILK